MEVMPEACRRKFRFCAGGRLRTEGLLIVSVPYAGVSRLHGERLAARKMPCERYV